MIMIIITIIIMNVEYIWLTLLNAIQIKVSYGVAYDFDQLIYTVCAPPWPAPLHRVRVRRRNRVRAIPRPALPCSVDYLALPHPAPLRPTP